MKKTLLFLFVVFGDFRNQVEPFSSSSECSTLGKEQRFFFPCSLPPFDISESFKYHKIDSAVNGETTKQNETKNPKNKKNSKETLKLWSWGFTYTNDTGDHK